MFLRIYYNVLNYKTLKGSKEKIKEIIIEIKYNELWKIIIK